MQSKHLFFALLMAFLIGCSGAPRTPAQSPPLTDAERHRKYEQLQTSTMGIPYVTSWYVDERRDRLVIGVGTLEAEQAVKREMVTLGLPADSVDIEHSEPLLSEAAPFAECQLASPPPADTGGRLTIPAVMKPGQEFDLTADVSAPRETITRGVDAYLECWNGNAWSVRHMLMVGFGSPDAKPTARVGAAGAVPTIGLSGPGPERLVLPREMPPGWYRIRKNVYVGQTAQTLTAVFEIRRP